MEIEEYDLRELKRKVEALEKCAALKKATSVLVKFPWEEKGTWRKVHKVRVFKRDDWWTGSVTVEGYRGFENHLVHNIADWL